MANVYGYTFDNMSRIGMDSCCQSQDDLVIICFKIISLQIVQ